MKINIYTNNEKYNMHCVEYKAVWQIEGKKIMEAFKKILKLDFNEKEITLLINEGKTGGNFSGDTLNEEMNFRSDNRCKIGTFLHELSHRIVLEYNLLEIAKEKLNLQNIHELIDLFLFDVLKLLYGEETAKFRVEYECGFEEEEYKNAWNYALNLSFEERQKKLSEIINEVI